MKTVLVTGASGSIGRQLVPALLARGWDVHAVSARPHADLPAGAAWHVADLRDNDAVVKLLDAARATHLVHLAWTIPPGKWAEAPENVQWVETSINLARRFAERGGKRFVGAGSCLEYDWRYGYCSEAVTPRTPHSLYGVCKNAVHEVVSGLATAAGFSAAWGRVFFVYGPHEHPDRLVASVIRHLLAGEVARCSHGEQIRDYLYAADVADAFATLLDSDAEGAVNIASGQPIALRDLVLRIGRALGRPDLIHLGAIPPAATDTPLVVANIDRLENEIGWTPRHSLAQGLDATIEWWRSSRGAAAIAAQR
jgi:nucleoside-diphosphate-sugar epimerase